MISQKKLKAERDQILALKTIVDVYGEVAAIRMMKIRNAVLKNRNFVNEIDDIFRQCLSAYAAKLSELVKRGKLHKGEKVTFLSHNGQTVSVLISANSGLYGTVISDTFRTFIDNIRKDGSEVTIMGKLGKTLFLDAEPNRPYTYFDLNDYGQNQDILSAAVEHLVQYEEIKIYYGKYISVITQKPDMVSISSGTFVQDAIPEQKVHYIFEPNVEKILMFFETQIFASLFDQALAESQLAKYASRILAMEEAGQNIKEELKGVNHEIQKLKHLQMAKKQTNSISALYTIK